MAFEYPGGKKEMKLEYVDKTSYLKAKRPDKVSFQSKDASRRDEFSNTFTTERYREVSSHLFGYTNTPSP
jgi:hypothetical protein